MKKAKAIQKLINESHLAIGDICFELDVSRFIVYKWRSGESNPRSENLNKLAKINDINLEWLSNDDVLFQYSSPKNNLDKKEEKVNRLDNIIQNQIDLIKIIRNDNLKLKNNLKKFQLGKQIINNHDYSIIRKIDDNSIVKIYVPANGLLGYTQKEFTELSTQWPNSSLFDQKVSVAMKKEEQKRVNIAKDLGIEHFDISNHILFCRKNSNKIWGYFMKNYDFILNRIHICVKFLDKQN